MQRICGSIFPQWFRAQLEICSSDLMLRRFIVCGSLLQSIRTEQRNWRVYLKVRPSTWLHVSMYTCKVLMCMCDFLLLFEVIEQPRHSSCQPVIMCKQMEGMGRFGIILCGNFIDARIKMKVRDTLKSNWNNIYGFQDICQEIGYIWCSCFA